MLQQIESWRSVEGSEMGDPALMLRQLVGMDDTLPMMTIMQFHLSGYFKRPAVPPGRFRIDTALTPRPS